MRALMQVLALVMGLQCVGCTRAASVPMTLKLARLDTPSAFKQPLSASAGPVTLLIFFEDQCKFCLQTMRDAQALADKNADTLAVVFVGVGSDRAKLNRWANRIEANRIGASAVKLQASTQLLALVDGVRATPKLVWLNAKGEILAQSVGDPGPAALAYTLAELLAVNLDWRVAPLDAQTQH